MRRLWCLAVASLGLSAAAFGQAPAFETGTIQPSGPRPPTGGDSFFNIEGADNGSFASYGVARFDVNALRADFDVQFPPDPNGARNWEVCRVDLELSQANASFTTDGDVVVYYTADDATDAKTAGSPLAYPFFDPNNDPNGTPDLPVTAGDPVATYTFTETASGDVDIHNLFISGDAGQRGALAADIADDPNGIVTLVLTEAQNAPQVAATYGGQDAAAPAVPPNLVVRIGPAGGGCPPVADAGPDQSILDSDFNFMEDVTLDGSASFDTDGSIVNYHWAEGMDVLADSNSPTSVVSLGLGTHEITLTVTDDDAQTDSDDVVVDVVPGGDPPFADAGTHVTVTQAMEGQPEMITLDASGSFDPDGMIISYTWLERDVVIASGEVTAADFGVGIHTVILVIEDNAGHIVRDVKFVKILPATTFARHNFDDVNDASTSQNPAAGTFTSDGDAFEIKQRGVSAAIPFAAADDTGSADPNGADSCSPSTVFPEDNEGVVMCAKRDVFFAAVDVRNLDNPNCDTASASFTFDITSHSDIRVAIDMGASGDFEAIEPNEANTVCDPNDFTTTPGDRYDWTWSVDGSQPQPLFTSSVDEAGAATYEYFSGRTVILQDPLVMNGTTLDNILQTISASVPSTGDSLTIALNARGDSSSEAYVFDDIVLYSQAAEPNVADCNCPGNLSDMGDPNGTVCDTDLDDLTVLLQNYQGSNVPSPGGDIDGDGDTDLDDLTLVLQDFGCVDTTP